MLLLSSLTMLLLVLALRYFILWRRFKIPEHAMMMGGMVVASVGFLIYSPDIVGFLLGIGFLAWGFGLWVDGQFSIITNLKWRDIRRGYTRVDVWLLRIHPK